MVRANRTSGDRLRSWNSFWKRTKSKGSTSPLPSQSEKSLATYATALEVYPGHIPTIQALARLQVRAGRADDRTAEFLDEIALRGETEEWRSWAQLQRLKLAP